MTETAVIKWIKNSLGEPIRQAIAGTIYPEDWLGAIAYRETGMLLHQYLPSATSVSIIAPIIKGDYGQRPGELEKQFHGFGFWQIDIGSYPEFIKSGAWKDPYKTVKMAVEVLEEKRKYLVTHLPQKAYALETMQRAITAAYNCGQGNVIKALVAGKDVDTYTYNHDYSKEVWRFREIYKSV